MAYHEIKIMNTSKDPKDIIVKCGDKVIKKLPGRLGFNVEIKPGQVYTVELAK